MKQKKNKSDAKNNKEEITRSDIKRRRESEGKWNGEDGNAIRTK